VGDQTEGEDVLGVVGKAPHPRPLLEGEGVGHKMSLGDGS